MAHDPTAGRGASTGHIGDAPEPEYSRRPVDEREMSRRQFLGVVSGAVGAVGAVLVAIPFVSFLLAPLLNRAPEKWLSTNLPS